MTCWLTQIAHFLLTNSRQFRNGFLSLLVRPKGTRTRQLATAQALTSFEKERMVTKRVAFGERC